MSKAIPQHRVKVEVQERKYVVVSDRCVWGDVGEVISRRLTDGQELGLIQGGVLAKYVPPAPAAAPTETPEQPADTKEGA